MKLFPRKKIEDATIAEYCDIEEHEEDKTEDDSAHPTLPPFEGDAEDLSQLLAVQDCEVAADDTAATHQLQLSVGVAVARAGAAGVLHPHRDVGDADQLDTEHCQEHPVVSSVGVKVGGTERAGRDPGEQEDVEKS